jgi:hypothetical protein
MADALSMLLLRRKWWTANGRKNVWQSVDAWRQSYYALLAHDNRVAGSGHLCTAPSWEERRTW